MISPSKHGKKDPKGGGDDPDAEYSDYDSGDEEEDGDPPSLEAEAQVGGLRFMIPNRRQSNHD